MYQSGYIRAYTSHNAIIIYIELAVRSLAVASQPRQLVLHEVKSNELESRIGAWTDIPYRNGHAPKRLVRHAPQNGLVATRRGYNEHIMSRKYRPTSNFVKSIESLFFMESH